MFNKTTKLLLAAMTAALLAGCQGMPTERGQQYKDGELTSQLVAVQRINLKGQPVNREDYLSQVLEVGNISPSLYNRNGLTYHAISEWLDAGADVAKLSSFGINAYQMKGTDGYGNVRFTGYYTPVIDARRQPDNEYKYPIYRLPSGKKRIERAEIYGGALTGQGLELAYSNSLIDNFMMEVQGSSYIDFADGSPLNFFAYAGKNGYPYVSIGRVLIDRGEIEKDKMSMQAIKSWVKSHDEETVKELLGQNPSFVFFTPKGAAPVKGASGIPLIAQSSVAADRRLVAPGTVILAEVPLLTESGEFSGKYDIRLMIALDVGGAIKGHHFDIYQGIGSHAGELAGFYNHFGRVWLLSSPGDDMSALLSTIDTPPEQ
jgi:membrane-bound lytic murein transglycosylase A